MYGITFLFISWLEPKPVSSSPQLPSSYYSHSLQPWPRSKMSDDDDNKGDDILTLWYSDWPMNVNTINICTEPLQLQAICGITLHFKFSNFYFVSKTNSVCSCFYLFVYLFFATLPANGVFLQGRREYAIFFVLFHEFKKWIYTLSHIKLDLSIVAGNLSSILHFLMTSGDLCPVKDSYFL